MSISKRSVCVNNFMYKTGLKAKLVQMTCPSDVFIEVYTDKLNVHAIRNIEGFVSQFNSEQVTIQIWNGALGVSLNDKIIEAKFGN